MVELLGRRRQTQIGKGMFGPSQATQLFNREQGIQAREKGAVPRNETRNLGGEGINWSSLLGLPRSEPASRGLPPGFSRQAVSALNARRALSRPPAARPSLADALSPQGRAALVRKGLRLPPRNK